MIGFSSWKTIRAYNVHGYRSSSHSAGTLFGNKDTVRKRDIAANAQHCCHLCPCLCGPRQIRRYPLRYRRCLVGVPCVVGVVPCLCAVVVVAGRRGLPRILLGTPRMGTRRAAARPLDQQRHGRGLWTNQCLSPQMTL